MNLNHHVAQRIVDRLASNLACGVSVTDAAAYVLASSEPHLLRTHLPAAAQAITTGQLCVQASTPHSLVAAPLIYADQPVGAILIHDAQHATDLARIARTLAELLIHQSTVIERLPHQHWAKDRFLSDLLRGRLADSRDVVAQEAAVFGIDLAVPRVVVVINIEPVVQHVLDQQDPHSTLPVIEHTLRTEQLHTYLLEQAQQRTHARAADVYGFVDDHRQVLLAAIDPRLPDTCSSQIALRIQPFVDQLSRSLSVPVSAGVGCYHPDQAGLVQSFTDATCALDTGRRLHGPGHVYCLEQLGLAAFTSSADQTTKATLARRLIAPLAAEPALLTTLDSFLRAQLSSSQTAERLHIHRHTLAYRLDKIARLTGRDPRRFDAAAELLAALMVYRTAGELS